MEAEALQVWAHAASRWVLGNEHPDTHHAASNLAITSLHQPEAETLQLVTLAVSRRVRGAAHPDTPHVARGLAHTCREQVDRDADAE